RFKAAFSLVPTPIIGIDLAREHVALQELIEAREVAIAVTKLPDNPKESPEGRTARVDAAKLANDLAPRIGTLVLTVDSLPESGVVLVDGAAMPKEMLGAPRKVNPGKHVVAVRVGDKETKRTVTVGEGAREEVRIDAQDLGPATSLTPANSSPSTGPSATEEGQSSAPIWPWIALGVGGVGVVGGVVFGLKWTSANNDYRSGCPNINSCVDKDGLEGARDTAATLTIVSGLIGAAGVTIGIIGLTSSTKAPPPTAQLRLVPGGATWTVSF
ncbi:hypothetical protein, partial [Gemmatimonas sp.]|uniref:hypothetical protein n=1 Tax=Gemmatimonas sp. TaxID=1962908 RepID=UPI0039839731